MVQELIHFRIGHVQRDANPDKCAENHYTTQIPESNLRGTHLWLS